MKRPTGAGLVRGIRRWDLVALVLNVVIGAGIFGLPSQVHRAAGAYSLFAYLICVLLIGLIVLCFAEVSSRFKETGGPYVYARTAFGELAGFEMGWLLWLARLTAFAALTNLFVEYLGFLVPAAQTSPGRDIVIIVFTVALTAVNIVGVRQATVVSDVFTVAKLLPFVLFIAVGVFFINPANFSFDAPPGYGDFSAAVLMLVFAFSGFEMAVIPAGETSDPRRDTPFALFTGLGFIAVLYIAIQVVSIGTLPELAQSTRPLADASVRFLGAAGATIIAVGALVSVTGTLNSNILAGPRLLFAMAEQGQLPALFARTHPRFRTPYAAILLSAAVSLVLTLKGTFISALTVSTIIRLITYGATCAALPVLRRRNDVPSAQFTAPAGTFVAIGALVLTAWLLSSVTPGDVRLAAVLAGAGLLLYFVFGSRARRTHGGAGNKFEDVSRR